MQRNLNETSEKNTREFELHLRRVLMPNWSQINYAVNVATSHDEKMTINALA